MADEVKGRGKRPWSVRRVLAVQLAIVLLIPILLGVGLGWLGLNPATAESLSPVGSEAHALLNSFPDSKLIVEFAYQVSGGPPPAASVSTLLERINETCQKSSVVVTEHSFASSQRTFSESDLWALETGNRQSWPEPGTMSLFYLFLAGTYSGDSTVLGLAYYGSSVAVFGGTITSASGSGATAVTTTVFVHEFGHELGLVGIVGSASNEDPAHPYHSSDPNDVMYWSVDSTALLAGLFGGSAPPNQFDAADMSDLGTVRSTPIFQELFPWAVLGVTLVTAAVLVLRARRRGHQHAPNA